jgi:hypothetical protein
MQSIIEPFEKAVKRQKTLAAETDGMIADIIESLSGNLTPQNMESAKKLASKFIDVAKDYQGALGKCTKAVEKKFKNDLDNIWDPKALEGKVVKRSK